MPTRSCIACRKRESWEDLLHLVVNGDQVIPDPNHTLPGRGAWLHPDCLEIAKTRRAFARAFPRESAELQRLGSELKFDLVMSYLLNS